MVITVRSWLLMRRTAWFLRAQGLRSVKNLKSFTFTALLLYSVSGNVYAADLQTILTNLSRIIGPLTLMVLTISYVAGIFMILHALTMMKKFGMQGVANQPQPGELGGPLLQLIVGTVLIYLPNSTDVFTNTLFDTTASIFGSGNVNYQNLGTGASLLSYAGSGGLMQQWAALANTLVLYIQFLGLLSFIKGWFIISKAASPGAQQGTVGRGLTHIIGGIIAINFVGAVNVINNTIFGT